MNNASAGESDIQVAPSFLSGLFVMKIAGIRTDAQLRTVFESEIGRVATTDEISDLLAIIAYIDAGLTTEAKSARLAQFNAVAGIWETGQSGITEAEARTLTGATFT